MQGTASLYKHLNVKAIHTTGGFGRREKKVPSESLRGGSAVSAQVLPLSHPNSILILIN